MRNKIWVAGIALSFGCAMFGGSQESKKSETRTQQDQAQQSLQRAADAQKKAADEQTKVEQARQMVTQKQKELADAQAKLRGQTASAAQLPPGSDLRASYQMVDGQPKALKIDATSKSSSSTQEPQQQK